MIQFQKINQFRLAEIELLLCQFDIKRKCIFYNACLVRSLLFDNYFFMTSLKRFTEVYEALTPSKKGQ